MRILRAAILAMLLTALLAPAAMAAPDDPSRRPVVAFLPVVNNASQKNTGYMIEMINDSLYNKFADRGLVLGGQVLADAFRRQGVDNPGSLDRETQMAMLRDMRVDYMVRAEIMPITTRQRVDFPDIFLLMKTWLATVPFACTVTNLHNGAVVYSFSDTEGGKHEAIIGFANRDYAIRIGLTKVLERFERDPVNLE